MKKLLLEEFIRDTIEESRHDYYDQDQDVPHGLSFGQLKQHLSNHFGKAKITITNNPLSLNRDYDPSKKLKPVGIWYGCGTGWFDFVEENNWQTRSGNQVWSLKIDMSKIKILDDPKEIDRFSRRYRDIERYIKNVDDKRVDWLKVANDFAGIEICPYPVGDLMYRYKHDWYYGIDVPSGCIWNASAITSTTLIAELKDDGWEVYV